MLTGLIVAAIFAFQEPTPTPGDGQNVTENFGPISIWEDRGDQRFLKARISGRLLKGDLKNVSGEVWGGKLVFYSDPIGSDEKSSQEITLWFRYGKIDGKTHTFDLRNGVDIMMEDGTRVSTEEAFVNQAHQTMICPKPVLLRHFSELEEMPWRTVHDWPEPDVEVSGDSLVIDNAEKSFTVAKNASLRIRGRPKSVFARGAVQTSLQETRLTSDGPLVIHDLSYEIQGPYRMMKISAEKNVHLERREPDDRILLDCQQALFFLSMGRTPETKSSKSILSVALRTNIRILDSRGIGAIAERLDWNWQEDILHLTGAPIVELVQGGQKVRAHEVLIDRWTRITTFHGDISATVRPPQMRTRSGDRLIDAMMGLGGLQPLVISSDDYLKITALNLEMESVQLGKAWRPGTLRAANDVRVDGPWDNETISARGDEFIWDAQENRIRLSASPMASLKRGENLILAPLILFEGKSLTIIKGPHYLRLVQYGPTARAAIAMDAFLGMGGALAASVIDDGTTRVTVTGQGELQFDSEGGLVTIKDRSEVRTQDSILLADVLYLALSPDGQGVEKVLGFGNVKLSGSGAMSRGGGKFSLGGDQLIFAIRTRVARMMGSPQAVLSLGNLGELRGRAIRINTQTYEMEVDGQLGSGELLMRPEK